MKSTSQTSRRDFLKTTGLAAAAGALPVSKAKSRPGYVAENNLIQVALVGCGGRGTGAASNAVQVKNGPTKIVAMADVFPERVKTSYDALMGEHPEQTDVPEDRRFIGFDAYRDAMDCLNPGDVVIFATPPAFRWVHFKYAIEKGLHVFMEKPVTVDGPTTRRMLDLSREASEKNLKVGVGLMVRHCRARQALKDRVASGEIGDIVAMRAYRMFDIAVGFQDGPRPEGITDLLYQVQKFHSFIWASGGSFSDFYVHQIDECSWMKGAWPVEAKASGGRHYRGNLVDQNFDNYSVEYTYPDGCKLYYYGRNMNNVHGEFASYLHGSNGSGIVSNRGHVPGKTRTFRDQKMTDLSLKWVFPQPEPDPYQMEWEDLIEAIREDKPYNEATRGAEASLVTSMGRLAAHTGQIVTYDQMLYSDNEYAPDIESMNYESIPPVVPFKDGTYPYPEPGKKGMKEW